MKETKAPRVNALHRGLQILELLAGQKKRWSTSEISRKLKIPKSSASYLLHTLQLRGYVRREEDGMYRLSMKLLALANLGLHGIEVREVALPILRRLVEETGITGHVAVLDGPEAVYIERVPSAGFLQVNTWVGRRMPLHSSGSGKLLLAYLDSRQVESLIGSTELVRSTSRTIVSLPRLRQELRRIRERGFAIDNQENSPGVRCVAAPIFSRDGEVVAALSLTGPLQQLTDERLMRVAEKVKDRAQEISNMLGGKFQPAPRRNA
jgi:IclR family transcriptional regulator, KDG regulon repressor